MSSFESLLFHRTFISAHAVVVVVFNPCSFKENHDQVISFLYQLRYLEVTNLVEILPSIERWCLPSRMAGLPGGSVVRDPPANAGGGLDPMDEEAWQATVHWGRRVVHYLATKQQRVGWLGRLNEITRKAPASEQGPTSLPVPFRSCFLLSGGNGHQSSVSRTAA